MLATVARYFDPWEAYILCARLTAEGIPARVIGDQHIIANWPMSVALGGAALQVPEACLEEALGLVAAYHSGELEKELIDEDPAAAEDCPCCGSRQLVRSTPLGQRVSTLLTFLLFSTPFPTTAIQTTLRVVQSPLALWRLARCAPEALARKLATHQLLVARRLAIGRRRYSAKVAAWTQPY
jgi:hypothetical protein